MNIVLIHGAWMGGWCWRNVAPLLRRAGHQVFTPTLTGLGERAHLLNPSVRLSTFIDDVCAVIENEELNDVMLVGHSFGSMVACGVADRQRQSIAQLILLDGLIAQHGQAAITVLPPAVQAQRGQTDDPEELCMAVPAPQDFGVTDAGQVAWLQRRMTPHPLNAYTEPLALRQPLGNGLPVTYISLMQPAYEPLVKVREWARQQSGWRWRELAAALRRCQCAGTIGARVAVASVMPVRIPKTGFYLSQLSVCRCRACVHPCCSVADVERPRGPRNDDLSQFCIDAAEAELVGGIG